MSMQHAQYELLFLVLAINFDQFQILWGASDVQNFKTSTGGGEKPLPIQATQKEQSNSWHVIFFRSPSTSAHPKPQVSNEGPVCFD